MRGALTRKPARARKPKPKPKPAEAERWIKYATPRKRLLKKRKSKLGDALSPTLAFFLNQNLLAYKLSFTFLFFIFKALHFLSSQTPFPLYIYTLLFLYESLYIYTCIHIIYIYRSSISYIYFSARQFPLRNLKFSSSRK